MTKVITYGTYDLLHFGHLRLLERAKALGDYLIVGVTADDFDKNRGKINVTQSLMERVEALRATGIADEIIIEEYEGQKIDDIKRYDVDIFTIGSDWKGKFDYLEEFCRVIYLPTTEGISSSEIRGKQRGLRLGLVGDSSIVEKVVRESVFVNGLEASGLYSENPVIKSKSECFDVPVFQEYDNLIDSADAIYIVSSPRKHFKHIAQALEKGKHVLCESPIVLNPGDCDKLFQLAHEKQVILMESIKTAYSTAYHRMILLIKAGVIGKVVSVDATCTSIRRLDTLDLYQLNNSWNSICAWGPNCLLPIFQILGTKNYQKKIISHLDNSEYFYDGFTKIDFVFPNAVASIKVGQSVKSEGELIVSGDKGYVFVPAPWWKTEYFEVRYENAENNRRYFYQLDGEGIRYELVSFTQAIETGKERSNISQDISREIVKVIGDFYKNLDTTYI